MHPIECNKSTCAAAVKKYRDAVYRYHYRSNSFNFVLNVGNGLRFLVERIFTPIRKLVAVTSKLGWSRRTGVNRAMHILELCA